VHFAHRQILEREIDMFYIKNFDKDSISYDMYAASAYSVRDAERTNGKIIKLINGSESEIEIFVFGTAYVMSSSGETIDKINVHKSNLNEGSVGINIKM